MPISSRTPEGDPNTCPVCRKDLRIDPSTVPTKDAPCPHCGHLLDFGDRLALDELFAPPVPTGVTSSFEKQMLELGRPKLGNFPFGLRDKLIEAIAQLALRRRLPTPEQLSSLIGSANNWPDAIDLLKQHAKPKNPFQHKGLRAFLAKITGNH
jgi:hypothetical protein